MPAKRGDTEEERRRRSESRRVNALLRKALGLELIDEDEKLLAGKQPEPPPDLNNLLRRAAGRAPDEEDS